MRHHPHVQHPSEYMVHAEGKVAVFNNWAVSHLAAFMGMVWTIWCFLIYPLVLLALPAEVKNVGFYIASGWIQLWALPLFVYVGNKLQQSQNAQSDAQHVALTSIANKIEDIDRTVEEIYKLVLLGVQK